MLSVVAMRYAKALVDVILAPNSGIEPQKALDQLRTVDQLIEGSADLRAALLSPAVAPSRKHAVMGKLLEPLGVSPVVRNFLFVVIDHRRVGEFSSIVEAVEVVLDERLGFVRADVISAQALSGEQQSSLATELSRLAGRQAKLNFSTDPALVAGVVARVGSTVYDGSVRGQLERLRTKLGKG